MARRIVRNRAQCNVCKDIVESLHRHDYRTCTCRSIAVDGGTDYIRRVGAVRDITELTEYEEYDEPERDDE